jgi:hypothetical protein
MSKLILKRKRDAIFRSIRIIIDKKEYKLKRNTSICIDLPAGKHQLLSKLDWCSSEKLIDLKENDTHTILIKGNIPDLYFFIGVSVISLLCIISFFELIPVVYPAVLLSIYYIPLMIEMFIHKKSYFKFVELI